MIYKVKIWDGLKKRYPSLKNIEFADVCPASSTIQIDFFFVFCFVLFLFLLYLFIYLFGTHKQLKYIAFTIHYNKLKLSD